MQKHFNGAAGKQRDDIARANADMQKALEAKGPAFNQTDAGAFQQALARASSYKDWRGKFGDEAWALPQRYAGGIG